MSALLNYVANTFFPRLSRFESNAYILAKVIGGENFRGKVVQRLRQIDGDPNLSWDQDIELILKLEHRSKKLGLFLPDNESDKKRWTALVCVAVCEIEKVDHRTVLTDCDYLPKEEAPCGGAWFTK